MGLNRLGMAVERAIIRVTTNQRYLRLMYLIWVAFPYPLRKPLTALVILSVWRTATTPHTPLTICCAPTPFWLTR